MDAKDGGVGFDEGMLWLPSHVLDEACDTKVRPILYRYYMVILIYSLY